MRGRRWGFGLLAGACLLAASGRADTVLMDDGTLVSGKITALSELQLTVKEETGRERMLDRGRVVYASFQDWPEIRARGIKGDNFFDFGARVRLGLPARTWKVQYLNPELGIEGAVVELSRESDGLLAVLAAEPWPGSLDEYVEALQELFKKNLGDSYRPVADRPLTFGGTPGRAITFSGLSEKTPITYKVFAARGEGSAYRLLCWTQTDQFEKGEKEFDAIARGFNILGRKK